MLSDEQIKVLIVAADAEYDAGLGGAIWPLLFARHVQRAAYERAAQECHAQKGGLSSEWGDGHDTGCDDCFAAIRALGRQHD